MEKFFSPTALAPGEPQLRFGKIDDLASRVTAALDGARELLASQQHEEGYWCGEFEADSTLESDYIFLDTLLGPSNPERIRKASKYVLEHQNDDGGWGIFAGGPSNVSASVKAYFGLKLAGHGADHPAMARARRNPRTWGRHQVNTFTKIYFCFFGQYDYDTVPAVPPEIVLFPNWFWFNIYEFLRGRAQFWFRFRLLMPKSLSRRFPTKWAWKNYLLADAISPRMHLPWDNKPISWRNFF